MLTQEYVRELFDYRDGVLYWRVSLSNRVHIGTAAGGPSGKGYLSVRIDHKNYRNHRIIWLYHYGTMPEYIDHKDNNRGNNNVENLRAATINNNNHNCSINKLNTSGVKGVNWDKRRNKWQARIKLNKKVYFLGLFSDITEARNSVMNARERYHGEFANHG